MHEGQDRVDLNVGPIRFPNGEDATPLLAGTPWDVCQYQHRGTDMKGSIRVRFADVSEESVDGGDVCFCPPGQMVWAEEDCEAIAVSPSVAMGQAIYHLTAKLNC